jgi:hypothetical protein
VDNREVFFTVTSGGMLSSKMSSVNLSSFSRSSSDFRRLFLQRNS